MLRRLCGGGVSAPAAEQGAEADPGDSSRAGSVRPEGVEVAQLRARCGAALRGKCRHFYSALLDGVSGSFRRADVACVARLLGPGLLRAEVDGEVVKAEGPEPPSRRRRLLGQEAPRSVDALPGLQVLGPLQQMGSAAADAAAATAAAATAAAAAAAATAVTAAWNAGPDSMGPAGLEPANVLYMSGKARSSDVGGRGWSNDGAGRAWSSSGSGRGISTGDGVVSGGLGSGLAAGGEVRYSVDGGRQSVSPERQAQLWDGVGREAVERIRAAEAQAEAMAAAMADEVEAEARAAVATPESMGQMAPSGAVHMANRPDVSSVDVREHANASAPLLRSPGVKRDPLDRALWHLDRIDQRGLPLDGLYAFGSDTTLGTGAGVTLYSVDSGVFAEHNEFQPWPDEEGGGDGGAAVEAADVPGAPPSRGRVRYGYDFVDDDEVAEDCDGHGTHVASTAMGRSVGVARGAALVAVRVLDCSGSGTIADTVAGLDWVARNAKAPAVALMSLGVPAGSWSKVLSDSVRTLVRQYGTPVVVASGNAALDSCTIVPANVPEALTVAASNLDTKFGPDPRVGRELIYQWANTGACVDLFAPGVEIFGACGGAGRCTHVTRGSYTWASGTSMAVPAVAGAAALYLEAHPTARPEEVAAALLESATRGAINDPRMMTNTPNRLLYSRLEMDSHRPGPVITAASGADAGTDGAIRAAAAAQGGAGPTVGAGSAAGAGPGRNR